MHSLPGDGVQVLNHGRPGRSTRQDGYSIGQEMGGVTDKPQISMTGQFPGGQSQGPDTKSG